MKPVETATKAETPTETFYCIWPEHKVWVGDPMYHMTAAGERGTYSARQRVQFENQRLTTSDPAVIEHLNEQCKKQPLVFSKKWIANPVLSRRDDLAPNFPIPPNVMRGPAVARS